MFSLTAKFVHAQGHAVREAGALRNLAIVGLLPCAGRRGRLVKNAYGSCARVRGGERSAYCLMVCAHGRRQRREVARMDMRSYNEQVKRAFAPTRPGGRVPVTGPRRYPRST